MTISQTATLGYPAYTVCYKCTNSHGDFTNTFTVQQKIDCANAYLTSNSTSLLKNYVNPIVGSENYDQISYDSSSASKALSEYTSFANLFTLDADNSHADMCGPLTNCVLRTADCSASYSGSGMASIVAGTGALSIRQDIQAGYSETLCVQCTNAGGSVVQHANWAINQKRDCKIAMTQTASPRVDQVVSYYASADLVARSPGWA